MSAYKPGMFCWNEIGTRDVPAAKKFYSEVFGWEVMDVPMPGDMPGSYTLFQINGKDIAGMYDMSTMPHLENVPPFWLVYMWSDEVDATLARAKELKGTVQGEAMDVPGVGRIGIAQDPTGAMFGLFQGKEHAGASQPGNRHGNICWRELLTNDTDTAGKFYTDLFGWGTKASGPPMHYTEYLVNEVSEAGMMAILPEMGPVPPNWGIYVQVDDCDAASAKAKGMGAKELVPPTDIPNAGRFSTVHDPTGAVVSMIKLNPR